MMSSIDSITAVGMNLLLLQRRCQRHGQLLLQTSNGNLFLEGQSGREESIVDVAAVSGWIVKIVAFVIVFVATVESCSVTMFGRRESSRSILSFRKGRKSLRTIATTTIANGIVPV